MKNGGKILKKIAASGGGEKRFIVFCGVVGGLAGLLAVAFRVSIEKIFEAAWRVGGSIGEENRFWLMPLIPALGGVVVGLCVSTFAKSASGSGIPQTKAAYYNNFGIFRWRDVLYRFCLGSIFCGFGNSAGREGPTVHLCSAASSSLAQAAGFPKERVRDAVPAGMGAGIAASFNAPLSAISFVFEELLGGFGTTKRSGGIILAVVIAAGVARLILGENPVLPVGVAEFRTGWWMFVALPIAIFSGLTGETFLALLLKFRDAARTKIHLPAWALAGTGGLAVGIAAIFAYAQTGYNSVFSVGYGILIPAFGGEVCAKAMLTIFVFKFFATIVNYAMGGSGGLFSPSLVIGGMLGGTVGAVAQAAFGLDGGIVGAAVLLGMGACFASIIRCPITSILMIFELTLNYSLILPLIAANLISYAIARKLHPTGLYDSLLLQDGITLRRMTSAKNVRDWANLPVAAIMTFHPVCLRADDTPETAFASLNANARGYHSYPVVDERGEIAGLISRTSIFDNRCTGRTCGELVRRKAAENTIFTDDSISSAANFFVDADAPVAVVADKSAPKKIVGILTLHDIARAILGS